MKRCKHIFSVDEHNRVTPRRALVESQRNKYHVDSVKLGTT